jgi:hypothetical protein
MVTDVKGRADAEIFTVTVENRETLNDAIVERAVTFLKQN